MHDYELTDANAPPSRGRREAIALCPWRRECAALTSESESAFRQCHGSAEKIGQHSSIPSSRYRHWGLCPCMPMCEFTSSQCNSWIIVICARWEWKKPTTIGSVLFTPFACVPEHIQRRLSIQIMLFEESLQPNVGGFDSINVTWMKSIWHNTKKTTFCVRVNAVDVLLIESCILSSLSTLLYISRMLIY